MAQTGSLFDSDPSVMAGFVNDSFPSSATSQCRFHVEPRSFVLSGLPRSTDFQSPFIWFEDFGFVVYVSTKDSWKKAEMVLAMSCRGAQLNENQKFRIESTKPGEHSPLNPELRGVIDPRIRHNVVVLHQMQHWPKEGWGGFDIIVTGTNIHNIDKASCLLRMFNMMLCQCRYESTMSTMTLRRMFVLIKTHCGMWGAMPQPLLWNHFA